MGSIKPYKESQCIDCMQMSDPDESVKITVGGRCLLRPHFHYTKHQEVKYKARQINRPKPQPKPKPVKLKQLDISKRSLSSLLLLAQETFNKYIRLRDSKNGFFVCISCGDYKVIEQMNAGHYYSMGNHSYLRFNESNVHGQCIKCNCHLHGALIGYREGLVKKIGAAELEKLDIWKNFSQKWEKHQVAALIQLYRNKIKTFA